MDDLIKVNRSLGAINTDITTDLKAIDEAK